MSNILIHPNSGLIEFSTGTAGGNTFNTNFTGGANAVRFGYDNIGGLNITNYSTGVSDINRFSVDGANGKLFSVTDSLSGSLFSVNDIAGLPIIEAFDDNTVIMGAFNRNDFVLTGNSLGLGGIPNTGTTKLFVSGNVNVSGNLTANNLVFNTGSQTISGLKTFATGISAPNLVFNTGDQTISGVKTFATGVNISGQVELSTNQAATTANSAMTRSLCEASYSNPITQGGTIVQVPAIALQRSTLVNGGTSLISNLTSQTPRVTCTTTLDSSAVLRATCNDGITTRVNSNNQKLFADKFGWVLIGFLGARGVGSRGKVIIGGNSTPAEMIVEGTLGSDGIALESKSLVANLPTFRLVVRNGATTTAGSFSGTGVYSIGLMGQWWIVMESGTTSAYYRLEQGPWILICSVAAVPASSTIVGGNGVAIVAYTPDSGATAGSAVLLNQIYETFGITPD